MIKIIFPSLTSRGSYNLHCWIERHLRIIWLFNWSHTTSGNSSLYPQGSSPVPQVIVLLGSLKDYLLQNTTSLRRCLLLNSVVAPVPMNYTMYTTIQSSRESTLVMPIYCQQHGPCRDMIWWSAGNFSVWQQLWWNRLLWLCSFTSGRHVEHRGWLSNIKNITSLSRVRICSSPLLSHLPDTTWSSVADTLDPPNISYLLRATNSTKTPTLHSPRPGLLKMIYLLVGLIVGRAFMISIVGEDSGR